MSESSEAGSAAGTDGGASHAALVEEIAARAQALGRTVGVAESLTGGRVAGALAAGPDAAGWFRGGVVAYAPEVKFDLLGVEPGPVNCLSCAEQMARGSLRVLGCDVAVSTTGVGGPGPDEGVPAGTVFLALAADGEVLVRRRCEVDGPPEEVVEHTTSTALGLLRDHLAP